MTCDLLPPQRRLLYPKNTRGFSSLMTLKLNMFRIALANIRFPATPEESVMLAEHAIAQAAIEEARLICFPECFIPGYRTRARQAPPPDSVFLERAWSAVAVAAAKAKLVVVLGTERIVD